MSAAAVRQTEGALSDSDRLAIFLFFLAGVSAAFFSRISLPIALPPRLLYSGLLGIVLFLSASFLGGVLLPVCALIFGVLTEHSAMASVSLWQQEQAMDLQGILCSAILVPVFFLAVTHGLTGSASMQTAFRRGSPTARAAFHRELLIVAFFALLGCAAIFYFY